MRPFGAVLLAVAFDYLGYGVWGEYLSTGRVYDGRDGITFGGTYAYGQLAAITLIAVAFSCYAAFLLWVFLRASDE